MENGQFVKPCTEFLILILGTLVHLLLVVVRVWQGVARVSVGVVRVAVRVWQGVARVSVLVW